LLLLLPLPLHPLLCHRPVFWLHVVAPLPPLLREGSYY
jgi:hypothetical protein